MVHGSFLAESGRPRVIGSLGSAADLLNTNAATVRDACDLVEVRLDLLAAEDAEFQPVLWHHLREIPLLFTARRGEEGGALPWATAARTALLRSVLDHAAWIDIEVASIGEAPEFLAELAVRKIPWIGSFHDFKKLPDTAVLEQAARLAKIAGASVFKAAARLTTAADLARLAEFQLAGHGLPVSTMGMGPLAPVSRLLCAQCGSVFNYGYLGTSPTAPGQWDSAFLKNAMARLAPFTADSTL